MRSEWADELNDELSRLSLGSVFLKDLGAAVRPARKSDHVGFIRNDLLKFLLRIAGVFIVI